MAVKQRFVVADIEVSKSLGQSHIIMLSDIGFWNNSYDDLQVWCNNNNADIQGMTVNIHDDATLTAFVLKWQ